VAIDQSASSMVMQCPPVTKDAMESIYSLSSNQPYTITKTCVWNWTLKLQVK